MDSTDLSHRRLKTKTYSKERPLTSADKMAHSPSVKTNRATAAAAVVSDI